MAKLAGDIWKTLLFSLILVSGVISLLRYLESDPWWKLSGANEEKLAGNPIVYYGVKGLKDNQPLKVDLFVRNNIQEVRSENFGAFENLLPGQSFSLRVSYGNQSIRSPSFILRDREIKHFSFNVSEGELVYVGSYSRLRKVTLPKFVQFEKEQETFAQIGLMILDNYNPLEEVKAKEEDNKKVVDDKENENQKKNNLKFEFFNFGYWQTILKSKLKN